MSWVVLKVVIMRLKLRLFFFARIGRVVREVRLDAWEDLAYLGDGEKKRADESRIGYG